MAAVLSGTNQRRSSRGAWYRGSWLAWLLAALADDGQLQDGDAHPEHAQPRDALDTEDAAFVALFARYQLPLLDFLYGMTRDREAAADLVQETFLRAYASGQEIASLRSPRAWLYRIASNAALNMLRRQRLLRWVPLDRIAAQSVTSLVYLVDNSQQLSLQDARNLAASMLPRDATLYPAGNAWLEPPDGAAEVYCSPALLHIQQAAFQPQQQNIVSAGFIQPPTGMIFVTYVARNDGGVDRIVFSS